MFVSAEPFQIVDPGTPGEARREARNPDEVGILVSPQRLVLEPGERRIVRIALVGPRSASERVFRVAIRPVSGPVSSDESALKVFVGFDTLVIVRPDRFEGDIRATRHGNTLILENAGNTAQELFEGRQCNQSGGECKTLPSKRLYP